uniref:Crossover junction endonuclease MUS81 n=1 Tax=Melopsittacus undulatus TaxID=13146 RepID=A0A8V5GSK8_MELUD
MAEAAGAAPPLRRRRRPRTCPNPLFTRWLREWRDEATGTRAKGVYERALRSLARYPLRLRSGQAAAILKNFGPALCRRLDLRLRQHRAGGGWVQRRGWGGLGCSGGYIGSPPPQPQTVGDVFVRQLLQLGGVSGGRAAAILRRFPTPASLMAAYGACPEPLQREALLSTVPCGPMQRNLGPSLSRSLAQLYSTPGPLP